MNKYIVLLLCLITSSANAGRTFNEYCKDIGGKVKISGKITEFSSITKETHTHYKPSLMSIVEINFDYGPIYHYGIIKD
ncbi:exported hypothetical protein [Vibrio jasicida]|uniref:hypothetical protein n=1 Tax=Vibrio jasicida TaxID=766224 RepID=UPI002894EF60|nr:exported hypothetical protein [Vibrio jasicida]